MKPEGDPQRWFCVEDCRDARHPVILMPAGTIKECHDFIENRRKQGQGGVYRLNYSVKMRQLIHNASQAA